MKWVDINEELPVPQRRVLVAMHAGTEWEFKAVGETRLVPMKEVQYWAPIASTPRRKAGD